MTPFDLIIQIFPDLLTVILPISLIACVLYYLLKPGIEHDYKKTWERKKNR